MRGLRESALVGMLTIAGCATVSEPPPEPNIYVMRHLHTPAGATDPDLTAQGQTAAAALAGWFAKDPPTVIYVSDTRRARQTAAPAAVRYGVAPKLYDPKNSDALVASVLGEHGTVVVVGHSNTVPDIIEKLGGQRPAPMVHEDFADVWRIAGPTRVTTHFKIPD